MKFDLYRHPDGTKTSILCDAAPDGKILLRDERSRACPRIERTDLNGNIVLRDDGRECRAFISVSDFLVLLCMRTDGCAMGCKELIERVISFCGESELVDTSDNPEWNAVRDRIQKFTFANKFTGPNATITNACTFIGDGNVFGTWLQKVNSRIALTCNCSDIGFRLPDYNSLLELQAQQIRGLSEPFAERYVRVPEKDTAFRTSSLRSLAKMLECGDQFVLKGKALTGKTTALKLIAQTIASDASGYLPVYVDIGKTTHQEDYPVKRFIERTVSEADKRSGISKTSRKTVVLLIDADEQAELTDNQKNELIQWRDNGAKILTTCALEDSVDCYLAPLTDNCLAEYLNYAEKNIHLLSYSPLRELPILHLYKSLLDNSDIAASVEVTKWDVLNSYFSPAFSGTPLPAVGFFSECVERGNRGNALAAVKWYINRSGNDEQKRALQGKYLFQWGAVEFISQVIKSGELCVDENEFKYSDCTSWGELLYESLKNTSMEDILQSSFAGNEEYHQFVLKCLYSAFNSYIDSLRNEDKAKVNRCEEVKDSLYRIFKLEFERIKSGKTACKSAFLQLARLCGEVFRRCYQFEKVDSIRRMVDSLINDDVEKEKYRLHLLSIDNNTAKAERARAVMMFAQQERVGNRGLRMETVSKFSAEYKEKKELSAPLKTESYMPTQDADMLRELLFCCRDDAAELDDSQYDYMIVLGSNSIAANCEQLISTVTSGKLKKDGKVILSGRYPENREGTGTKTEAERMCRYLKDNWERLNGMLAPGQLMLEEESTNAKENITCSFKLIKANQSSESERKYRVLIIAKAFMTYRVKMYIAYWVKGINVETEYLGVTEPEGTAILHLGKNDFETRPDSVARVYEEAIRLIKFSQYRTDGNMSDLQLPEETAKQLLKMLNRIVIYPDFFQVQRKGESEAAMYNLYLSKEKR